MKAVPTLLPPVFEMCNPGTEEQVNSWIENPRQMQQKFDEQFAAPLDAVLVTLLRPGIAPRSPIIETIQGLRSSGKERLMIVSDMLQNSQRLSFYNSYQAFNQDNIAEVCGMSSPYSSIEVLYVNRPGISVTRRQAARDYWDTCLTRMGRTYEWKSL